MIGKTFAIAVAAAPAGADVATWFWSVSDTGNRDGVIEPGESALLNLWVGFEPGATGFATAGPYTITGDARWSAGTVEQRENLLDQDGLFGNGTLDGMTNTISDIRHLQFPPAAGYEFNAENPIRVYSIRWAPGAYVPGVVTLDNDGPDAWIYIDDFGTTTRYTGAGGSGTFSIVPAPGAAASVVLGLIGFAARRRR